MGKQTPQAPTPPDPQELARAQAAYSLINQVTPFGSLTYSESGGGASGGEPSVFDAAQAAGISPEQAMYLDNNSPGWRDSLPSGGGPMGPGSVTATQTLTPELQALLDSQIANSQGASNLAGRAQSGLGAMLGGGVISPRLDARLDTSGLPQLSTMNSTGLPQLSSALDTSQLGGLTQSVGPNDFSADRAAVEQAFFDRTNNLLQPDFMQQEERLRQSLADRGLPVGSEAFEDELSLLRRNQDLSRNQLALDSVLAGGDEQSRLFGLDLAQGQFGNQARAQGFNELLTQGQFGNQARAQDFGERLAQTGFNNQTRSQGFNEGLTADQFRNQALTQQFGLDSGARSQQFNELAALMGGQQVQIPGLGSFMSPGGVDVLGANAMAQAGQNANYQNQLAQNSAKKGGATQLGSSAIMAAALSSKAFKTEIGDHEAFDTEPVELIDRLGALLVKVQRAANDADGATLARIKRLPVKTWRYHWDKTKHIGPYAEDFAREFGGDGKTIGFARFLEVLSDGVAELEAA